MHKYQYNRQNDKIKPSYIKIYLNNGLAVKSFHLLVLVLPQTGEPLPIFMSKMLFLSPVLFINCWQFTSFSGKCSSRCFFLFISLTFTAKLSKDVAPIKFKLVYYQNKAQLLHVKTHLLCSIRSRFANPCILVLLTFGRTLWKTRFQM